MCINIYTWEKNCIVLLHHLLCKFLITGSCSCSKLLRLACCRHVMTGSYNNFFRMFDRELQHDVILEASRADVPVTMSSAVGGNASKPTVQPLRPRRVCTAGKRRKDEISVDCLDFNKKILHTAWHPSENILALAATNNLYLFQSRD